MNWLKEHILEIIGIVLDLVLAKPFIGLFDKSWIGWLIIVLILVFLVLLLFRKHNVFFARKPKIRYSDFKIWGPHPPKIGEINNYEMYGVLWRFNFGSRYNIPNEIIEYLNSNPNEINIEYEQYIRESFAIWNEGPFCKKCNCELNTDTYKAKWVCPNCGEKYKIPKQIWYEPSEQVLKIFKSTWRNRPS